MMRLHPFLAGFIVLVVAACAAAPLQISVPGFTIPSSSSREQICYSDTVTRSVPIRFSTVEYEAQATYRPGPGIGNERVDVVFFGRSERPGSSCVARSDADIKLSGTVTLSANEAKVVRVGGGELADLVRSSEYWLGASLDEGVGFRLPGEIEFEAGVVRANF